jgi:hypothetical protein
LLDHEDAVFRDLVFDFHREVRRIEIDAVKSCELAVDFCQALSQETQILTPKQEITVLCPIRILPYLVTVCGPPAQQDFLGYGLLLLIIPTTKVAAAPTPTSIIFLCGINITAPPSGAGTVALANVLRSAPRRGNLGDAPSQQERESKSGDFVHANNPFVVVIVASVVCPADPRQE